ncbi:MAG: A/G-specific adenine glycosylase [Paludibacteraceae bacterium]|nr:A/G-specific adenine glycosylase [Paludibacteraceae bacterium]
MNPFHTALSAWYERNKRVLPWRETTDPYCIWLSEIILQQTRVQQGMDYYHRFVSRFPDVRSLAEAEEDEVLLLWQGLGYYSRARNLHKAAKMVVENGWLPFPDTFDNVRALPGVGEYTAGAIMSFAYDAPYPAADGNVYRVLSRLFDEDEPFDTTAGKKRFRALAQDILDTDHPRLHNSAIMEFGALYCTPTGMDCDHCPLRAFCLAAEHGTAELLPVRKPRPTLRDRYFHYTVYLTPDRQTLLHQRTAKDIWQHLYEFPLEELDTPLSTFNCTLSIFNLTHILSHQRIHAAFTVEHVPSLPAIDGCFPIPWSDLSSYALSRLTLRFLEQMNENKSIN